MFHSFGFEMARDGYNHNHPSDTVSHWFRCASHSQDHHRRSQYRRPCQRSQATPEGCLPCARHWGKRFTWISTVEPPQQILWWGTMILTLLLGKQRLTCLISTYPANVRAGIWTKRGAKEFGRNENVYWPIGNGEQWPLPVYHRICRNIAHCVFHVVGGLDSSLCEWGKPKG